MIVNSVEFFNFMTKGKIGHLLTNQLPVKNSFCTNKSTLKKKKVYEASIDKHLPLLDGVIFYHAGF